MSDRYQAAQRRMRELHLKKIQVGNNTLIKAVDANGKSAFEVKSTKFSEHSQERVNFVPGTTFVPLNTNNLKTLAENINNYMIQNGAINPAGTENIFEAIKMVASEYGIDDTKKSNKKLIVDENGNMQEYESN